MHALDGASIVRGGCVHQAGHDETSAPESCRTLSLTGVHRLSWYMAAWALWRSAPQATRDSVNTMRQRMGLNDAVLAGDLIPETLPRFIMHALVAVTRLPGDGFAANSISDYLQILQQTKLPQQLPPPEAEHQPVLEGNAVQDVNPPPRSIEAERAAQIIRDHQANAAALGMDPNVSPAPLRRQNAIVPTNYTFGAEIRAQRNAYSGTRLETNPLLQLLRDQRQRQDSANSTAHP